MVAPWGVRDWYFGQQHLFSPTFSSYLPLSRGGGEIHCCRGRERERQRSRGRRRARVSVGRDVMEGAGARVEAVHNHVWEQGQEMNHQKT